MGDISVFFWVGRYSPSLIHYELSEMYVLKVLAEETFSFSSVKVHYTNRIIRDRTYQNVLSKKIQMTVCSGYQVREAQTWGRKIIKGKCKESKRKCITASYAEIVACWLKIITNRFSNYKIVYLYLWIEQLNPVLL